MKLKQARRLRDFLRKHGIKCTVPLGYADDGYFVQWCQYGTQMRFYSVEEYNAHVMEQHRRLQEFADRNVPRDTRSPIERMIDQACGYKGH